MAPLVPAPCDAADALAPLPLVNQPNQVPWQAAWPPRPLFRQQMVAELAAISGESTYMVESVLQSIEMLAGVALGRGTQFTLPGLLTLTPHIRLASPPRRQAVCGVMRDIAAKPTRLQVKAKVCKKIKELPVRQEGIVDC